MSKKGAPKQTPRNQSKDHAPRHRKGRPESRSVRGPGKPTISDDELIEQRNHWAYALENHWGEVGWNLRCARTLEHIRAALQPLTEQGSNPYPLSLLLRPTTKTVSAGDIRGAKKALGVTVGRMYEAQDIQRKASEAFQKAESAAYEFSDKSQKGLQGEIERRERNLCGLEVTISEKNAEIRRNGLLLKKADEQTRPALEVQLKSLHSEIEKIEADISSENGVVAEIQKRLRALTPEKRKLVDTVFAHRKAELDAANQQTSEANAEYKRLEGKLNDQQSHFCQHELLTIIRGKRYAHTPRNLANAIAGLPVISCRQSAARCAKILYTWEPDYTIVEFMEKTWRQREAQPKVKETLDLFRTAIAALPKTLLGQPGQHGRRKRVDNYFRRDLCEKWFYLKQAIQDALRSYQHPNQVPYLITAKFKENIAKPRTAADELFAAQDAIKI